MAGSLITTRLDLEAPDRFNTLRRPLGLTGAGLNLILLRPGERGRVHDHRSQEEVYLVWEGTLTVLLDGGEKHELRRGDLARVPPGTRRQVVNRTRELCAVVALGVHVGDHQSRDGLAWESFDDHGEAKTPQEIPLPPDLPASELRP